MKNIIYTIFLSCLFLTMSTNINAQCPSYAANPTSGNEACANVEFIFEIPNTDCPSSVTWTVQGNSGSNGNDLSWQITNLMTGAIVASYGTFGAGSANGSNFAFSTTIGPDPVATVGTSYNLEYHDNFGDGLTGGGNIEILDFQGNTITLIDGTNFTGTSGNTGFATPQQVSSVTAMITTSAGTITSSLVGCAPVFEPFTFTNASFCTSTTENIAWSLVCDETSAVLSSGNMDITVNPSIPTAASEIVTIAFDASNCTYSATPVGDCLGSEYSISPDPASLSPTAGTSGNQAFTVTYTGLSGATLSCCDIGGPAVPKTFIVPSPTASATPSDSPFGGTLNSALLSTGPAGDGGVAVSGSFDVTVSGYDYPDANRPNQVDAANICVPGLIVPNTFWVTIYVDGTLVSDEQTDADGGTITVANPAGPMGTASVGGYTTTITFADVQNAGVTFNENSVIEAFVYPNSFSGPEQDCSGGPTTFATYSPGAALTNPGEWDATVSEISAVNFEFIEQEVSPADCDLDETVSFACPVACAADNGVISITGN